MALTRTRRDLVVCVDQPTYTRLQTSRAEFVAGFECLTVEALLERLEPAPSADVAIPA